MDDSLLSAPYIRAFSRPIAGRPSAGTQLYAVGDIHGRLDLLDSLHRLIEADAAATAPARLVVVYVGDYIDRGPDTRGVLDRLIEQPLGGFECVHLRGNHEAEMLRFIDGREPRMRWLDFGGAETIQSYGVEIGHHHSVRQLQQALAEAVPERHLQFLRRLRNCHVEGDFLLVHAGIRPGVPLDAQSEEDLLWIREPFLRSEAVFDKIVIHGHTITPQPQARHNRIGIDTGAFRSGRLTAVVLDDGRYRFLETQSSR